MILARDLPLIAIQTAVFKTIKTKQDMPVMGAVTDKTPLPYITVDSVSAKPDNSKNSVGWRCSVNVNIWSSEHDKKKIYEALNDITTIFSVYGCNLDLGEAYEVTDCDISLAETFPEQTAGFHGLIILEFFIERK